MWIIRDCNRWDCFLKRNKLKYLLKLVEFSFNMSTVMKRTKLRKHVAEWSLFLVQLGLLCIYVK